MNEINQEPICTIDLKCDYNDYVTLLKSPLNTKRRKTWPTVLKAYSIFSVIMIIVLVTIYVLSTLDSYRWPRKSILEAIIIYGLLIFSNIVCWVSYKNEKILFFKPLLKRQSIAFTGRSIEEIKKITIPCRLCFYDTYLTKTTPSVEKTKLVLPEEIEKLPLEIMTKVEYNKRFFRITETDQCISFYPGIFVPKTKLSECEKARLEIIKKIVKN